MTDTPQGTTHNNGCKEHTDEWRLALKRMYKVGYTGKCVTAKYSYKEPTQEELEDFIQSLLEKQKQELKQLALDSVSETNIREKIVKIWGLETSPDGEPDFLLTYDVDGNAIEGVDMSTEVKETVEIVKQTIKNINNNFK